MDDRRDGRGRSGAVGRRAGWTAAVVACGALLAGCGAGSGWPGAAGPAQGQDEVAAATPAAAELPEKPVADGSDVPGGAAPAGGPVAEGAERCHTSELGGSLVADPAGGAAGSTYATLVLRNDSGRTCVVRGFPGLSYVGGDDGAQVGPAAAMQGGHGDPVQLAPGASAGARVRMVNAHNFDPADCAPVPTRGFRVYPPGETDSLFVAQDGTGCSGRPPGDQLTVEAFGPQ
jgi:hypothetical protein